jgi:hypothetical protein
MAFGLPYEACIIGMAIVTCVYVVLGGYMATVVNDFVQGIIMLLGIIAVIWAVLATNGGASAAIESLSQIPAENSNLNGAFVSFFGPDLFNLLGVVVSGTIAADDEVDIADLRELGCQNGSGCMSVEIRASVIGDHDELFCTARQNVLLELGLVDGRAADCQGNDLGVANGLRELSCSLDGVEVIRGNGLMRLGHVKLACGGYLDILVIRNDFYSDNDVHLNPFLGCHFSCLPHYRKSSEN